MNSQATSTDPAKGSALLNYEWLEHFYKECGREVTLAYTTLNQMKNWAMIVAAATITGIGFGLGAQVYPSERAFVGVVIVYTFVLRFFFRAIICYINICRWNELQHACLKLMLFNQSDPPPSKREEELHTAIELYYFRWLSTVDRKTQIISNLKLGFALLLALPNSSSSLGELLLYGGHRLWMVWGSLRLAQPL